MTVIVRSVGHYSCDVNEADMKGHCMSRCLIKQTLIQAPRTPYPFLFSYSVPTNTYSQILAYWFPLTTQLPYLLNKQQDYSGGLEAKHLFIPLFP